METAHYLCNWLKQTSTVSDVVVQDVWRFFNVLTPQEKLAAAHELQRSNLEEARNPSAYFKYIMKKVAHNLPWQGSNMGAPNAASTAKPARKTSAPHVKQQARSSAGMLSCLTAEVSHFIILLPTVTERSMACALRTYACIDICLCIVFPACILPCKTPVPCRCTYQACNLLELYIEIESAYDNADTFS